MRAKSCISLGFAISSLGAIFLTSLISIDELWEYASLESRIFLPDLISALPPAARRYLEHAIAPGTPLATAVRLRMHGEIKLKGWLPFTAEQVIRQHRGMIWKARTHMHGLPISGSDRLIDGEGEMRWKLCGIFPIMNGSGPDLTRSAAGRFSSESIWLPSSLCTPEVIWKDSSALQTQAKFKVCEESVELNLTQDSDGHLTEIETMRWGNPDETVFCYDNFGGVVEEEGSFAGYTIPTQVRVGWHFGTDRFESEGEFFRVTVDSAEFR